MNTRAVTLITTAIFALFMGWFLVTHEQVSSEEYVGYQGEARYNHFLAAELLLNEVGIEAESHASLSPVDWLPDYSDTLFVSASPAIAIPEQRFALEQWVSLGGHLVLMPPSADAIVVDDFLLYFGYQLAEVERDDPDTEAEQEEDSSAEEDEEEYEYSVDVDQTRHRVIIEDGYVHSASLSDDKGIVVARQQWGDGYVTIVADHKYFLNTDIGDLDHGRLFLDTVAGYIDPGKVWLVYDASFSSLWQLIWDNAPYAVLGAAALILVSLWAVVPAFGPMILPEPPARRSIVEHVNASGTFVWKQRGASSLGRAASSAIVHKAERRRPGIGRMALAEQAKIIAEITDMEPQVVFDALQSDVGHQARDFTLQMQTLHRVRKEI